jgi:glutathione peroxidase
VKLAAALGIIALLAASESAQGENIVSFYDLTASTLEGTPKNLSDYKGKVLVIVNTASQCGYTPQYAGLETLYENYKDKGVVVLGFPSNDFGGQEPGTAAEIKTFCEKKYNVTFPMFAKVKTKGEGQSPVYAFLVGKDGQVTASFPSSVKPDSEELKSAIEAALKL